MARDILTDLETGVYVADYRRAAPCDADAAWSIEKKTLRGGVSDGVDLITVDNGRLALDVIPTRGMGVWRGRCDDMTLGWESPAKFPVHPRLVERTSRGGFGWLDGFNEWICRCGLASVGNPEMDAGAGRGEANLTLHGRIANLPAHRVAVEMTDDPTPRLRVEGVVDEAALFGPKLRLASSIETVAGSTSLKIVDQTTNLSDEPSEFELMYHVNFGASLLEAGAELVVGEVTPTPYDEHSAADLSRWRECQGPTPGYQEQCFFFTPGSSPEGRATILLRNAAGDRGVSLLFSDEQLPCATFWKHLFGRGDGYVVGIEPGTNFPNCRSVERAAGRLKTLEPGETYETTLEVACHLSSEEVRSAAESLSATTAS